MEGYLLADIQKNIRCADCAHARQDARASEYTPKRCGKCAHKEGCRVRDTGALCGEQALKWAAIECGNPHSEYYRALLNVTPGGQMRDHITWGGCPCGERGDHA